MNLENEIETQTGGWVEDELDVTLSPSYVANAFTKTEDKVNLEVDNANIACLTSRNNKFSLDEEGNLVVNSLTCNNSTGTTTFNILDAYPVGSIYLSVNEMNPSNFFGGTWELWGAGRCLVGVDITQEEFDTVSKTGGEKEHLLTVSEMPSHAHDLYVHANGTTTGPILGIANTANANLSGMVSEPTFKPLPTGGNQPHNNLQPYITCYMWKRAA